MPRCLVLRTRPPVGEEGEVAAQGVEAAAKAQGLTTGFAAGIELRHLINSHTDTFALGPISATDLVALAQGN